MQLQVQIHIENVIKKGLGNRPVKALATLYLVKKVLHSTGIWIEYSNLWKDNKEEFLPLTGFSCNILVNHNRNIRML